MSHFVLTRRNLILGSLLAVGLVALAFEFALIVPLALERWYPFDYYSNYLEMGRAVRQGLNPYGINRYYPLPTVLWIFVPLSLMPDWFLLVWVLFPFIFILILFRMQGILFLLFPPLWFVVSDAMFDGWLLIPLAWLFTNRPILAGFGAAVLLFKPHVTLFAVAYMALLWIMTRDWKNLAVFAGALGVLWLPSFVVNPGWLFQMLAVLQIRVDHISTLPLLTTSLWSWWWLDGLARVVFVAMLLAMAVLSWRAFQRSSNRAPVFQILGLLLNPVILASNLVTVLPALRGRTQIIIIVLVSWAAYALDRAVNYFGGGYALIPLAALYFLTRTDLSNSETAAAEDHR